MHKNIIIFFLSLSCHYCFGQNIPYDSLVHELSVILEDDQRYRAQLPAIYATKGYDSTRLAALSKLINENDSLNLIKVRMIIDKYGWLGPDKIGTDGNQALFLVIQHADIDTQKKYLEVLRNAVKIGNAKATTLALLEDRICVAEGKLQIYGTQTGIILDTKESFIFPLQDPDGIEARRSQVGLEAFPVYLRRHKIEWDLEKYKADLPRIQAFLHGKYTNF